MERIDESEQGNIIKIWIGELNRMPQHHTDNQEPFQIVQIIQSNIMYHLNKREREFTGFL